jgi:hypothetical protein|tara:strand:- start:4267 stop:4512 length:246 start_codon:yes stop_codon:yes gene_type:complete
MENEARIVLLERNLINLDAKLDLILNLLNKDVKPNSDKMASHIDFVEAVYENVKNPLGFLCDKIRMLTGNAIENYTLETVN